MNIEGIISEANRLKDTGEPANGLFNRLRSGDTKEKIVMLTPELESGVGIGQGLYHLREGLNQIPKCPVCEKERAWYRYSNGYFETCGDKTCKQTVKADKFKETVASDEFADKKKEWFAKQKQTMLERHGVEHNWQGEMRKTGEETMIEKYGTKHALQNAEIKEKRKKTTEERHGTLDMFSLGKEKMLERYGSENAMHSEGIKEKFTRNMKKARNDIARSKLENHRIEMIGDAVDPYNLHCSVCDTCFKSSNRSINTNLRRGESPCPLCNPPSLISSRVEKEMLSFIKSIYNGGITENDRFIMKGTSRFSEVDIHLNHLKIAIEFNGLYWHGENHKDSDYHLEKSKFLSNLGISLYHIWEDDWNYKGEIIRSHLSKILTKAVVQSDKEYIIREIGGQEYKAFVDENDLTGYSPANIIFGLFDMDQMVAISSFKEVKSRMDGGKIGSWKIVRYTEKNFLPVTDGFNKLLKHFLTIKPNVEIFYDADTSLFPNISNNIFTDSGMAYEKTIEPNYTWCIDGVRESRVKWNKINSKSVKNDESKTWDEIMRGKGYFKIWDAGKNRFSINI
jgi:hypothetical protein